MPIREFVPVMNRNPAYAEYDIGDYSYGNPIIVAHEFRGDLRIGRFCSIAAGVTIFLGAEHRQDMVTTYPLSGFFEFAAAGENVNKLRGKGDTIIGNDVWIGHGAFILNGVTVGDGAVIGAMAVVAKDVAPYSVVIGNPAKHIKYRFPESIRNALLQIAWWDWPIEKIADAFGLMCCPDILAFLHKHGVADDSSKA